MIASELSGVKLCTVGKIVLIKFGITVNASMIKETPKSFINIVNNVRGVIFFF